MSELAAEVRRHLEALPAPSNGQVRAVPDERNLRYYTTLGLLDRPHAMRGRTALYGARHAAQVIAIKRMQVAGKSLAEITELWSTIDDVTLARMSGIALPSATARSGARAPFWKATSDQRPVISDQRPVISDQRPATSELRIALADDLILALQLGVAAPSLDLDRLRAAAAPLLLELARQRAGTT